MALPTKNRSLIQNELRFFCFYLALFPAPQKRSFTLAEPLPILSSAEVKIPAGFR
jgi:hypothetical protein